VNKSLAQPTRASPLERIVRWRHDCLPIARSTRSTKRPTLRMWFRSIANQERLCRSDRTAARSKRPHDLQRLSIVRFGDFSQPVGLAPLHRLRATQGKQSPALQHRWDFSRPILRHLTTYIPRYRGDNAYRARAGRARSRRIPTSNQSIRRQHARCRNGKLGALSDECERLCLITANPG